MHTNVFCSSWANGQAIASDEIDKVLVLQVQTREFHPPEPIYIYILKKCWIWWHALLIPELGRKTQVDPWGSLAG